MEVPGPGWEVGSGEVWLKVIDVPGLGREVLAESQRLQAGSETKQLLDLAGCWTMSLATAIPVCPGF